MNIKNRFILIFVISIFVLFFISFLRISVGTTIINIFKIDKHSPSYIIVTQLRIPKLYNGLIIGGTLALCGLILQILLRNPLAEPYTLGISSGASFGAVFIVFLSILYNNNRLLSFLPLGALIGSFTVVIFIFIFIINSKYFNVNTLILAGVIINSFFSSLIALFLSLLSNKTHIALSWLMGYVPSYTKISPLLFLLIILITYFFILFYWKELDIFYLPDSYIINLGINIKRKKLLLILLASFITSIVVSQSGIIGFVGFITPHFVRNILPDQNFKRISIISILWGGIILVVCDTLAQFLPSIFGLNSDIPVGVITSLTCSPIFIFLLLKKSSNIIY
ncbi:MAG: iron ABC transporter permease [Spirochaetes bacterium]|nr:iron ABC transporter permease [Spirochaetota bacterium]